MISRVRSILIPIALALLGLFLISSLSLYLLLSRDDLRQRVRSTLVRAMEDWTGMEVTAGDLRIAFPSQLIIEDLSLGSSKDLEIAKIRVGYSLWRYLTAKGDPMAGVTFISLENPTLYLKDGASIVPVVPHGIGSPPERVQEAKDAPMAKPTKKSRTPIPEILVKGGTLVMASEENQELRLEAISGTLKRRGIFLELDASGRVPSPGNPGFHINGFLNMNDMLFSLKADFSRVDLGYISQGLSFDIPFVTIYSCQASGMAEIRGGSGQPLKVSGNLKVKDGQADVATINGRFQNVEGTLSFTTNSIEFDRLSGNVKGVPTEISGKILDFKAPAMDLKIKSGFNGLKLYEYTKGSMELLGLEGEGQVQVQVQGPSSAPMVTGSAHLAKGLFYGQNIRNMGANFQYHLGELQVGDIKGEMAGGSFSGHYHMSIEEKGSDYTVTATVSRINLGELNLQVPEEVSGFFSNIDGQFKGEAMVTGVLGELPDVAGNIHITQLIMDDWGFEDVEGLFWFDGQKKVLTIDNLEGEGGGSDFRASGNVDIDGPMDLEMKVNNFEIQDFMALLSQNGLPLEGRFNFHGNIGGTLGEPQVTGALKIPGGKLFNQGFDEADGHIQWNGQVLTLSDGALKGGDMEYGFSGTIIPNGPHGGIMELDINVKEVDVKSLLGLAQLDTQFVAGKVSGEFKIQGPISQPITWGNLALRGGRFRTFFIDDGALSFRVEGKNFYLEDFTGNINGSPIHLKGSVQDAETLDFDINAHQMDLGTLDILKGHVEPVGRVDLTGNLKGTLQDFRASGRVSGTDVGVRDLIFHRVEGDFTFLSGNKLPFITLLLEKGQGTYNFNGKDFLLTDGNLWGKIDVKLEEVDLTESLSIIETIFPSLDLQTHEITGKLDGQVNVERNGESSIGSASLIFKDVGGSKEKLNKILLDASLKDDSIAFHRIEAHDLSGGNLSLYGTADRGGRLSMNAEAEDFSVSALLGLWGVEYALKGKGTLSAKVKGTLETPELSCEFKMKDIEAGGFFVGDIEGAFDVEGNIINIKGATVTNREHKAFLTGKFPATFKDVRGAKDLDAYIELKRADFGFLPVIFPAIGSTAGEVDASLRLTHASGLPELYGELNLRGGYIENAFLMEPVTGMEATLEFKGDKIFIESINGAVGKNGRIRGKGEIAMDGLNPSLFNLELDGTEIGLALANYRGYLDTVLKADGAPGKKTLVGGILKFYNGDVLAQMPKMSGTLPIDLLLDLNISVGRRVSLKAKGIDIPFTGELKLGGSLSSPMADGRLETSRGNFVLFGTQFSLNNAVVDFTPMNGLIPHITAKAEGIVQGVTLYADAIGNADDIKIIWTSDPPMPEEEILSLLTLPKMITDLISVGASDRGDLSSSILRYLENEISSQILSGVSNVLKGAFSLDELIIERNAERRFEVKVGKYLVDILYLGYIREISLNGDRGSWNVEYRAQPNISLKGILKGDGEYRLMIETKYQF
jgi:autotransporter translocation and assembly factor TamB